VLTRNIKVNYQRYMGWSDATAANRAGDAVKVPRRVD
jgi:hypothetical protein